MAWVESHQEIARHPKTRRLARLLGVSVPAAIGHLHLLWWFAMDFAEDGKLDGFEREEIAAAVMWEDDPDRLWDALVSSRFVDATAAGLIIHDWDDYAGRLIDRKRANAERMRDARARRSNERPNGRAPDVHSTCETREKMCGATGPNRTGPDLNRTGPNRNPSPNPSPQAGKGLASNGRRRRGEDPDEIVEPLTPRDEELWQAAIGQMRGGVRRAYMTGMIEPLVPLGRTADGGLRLRAPPNVLTDAQRMMSRVVTRVLEEVGDEAGSRAAIVG